MRNLLMTCICAFALTPIALAAEEHSGMHMQSPGKSLSMKSPVAKQTTCPVSGKPIDPAISTNYEGQKVYFCSKGCIAKFKESPTEYLPALYRQIYPQHVQTACPVTGDDINPKVFTDYKGQRVYFCCKDCLPKFKANPDKYLPKLSAAFTEQVHCPVSGDAINPAVSIDRDGKKVYFCCKGCPPKFKADPAKYEAALRPTAGLLAYGKSAADDLVLCPLCLAESIHKRSETKAVQEYNGLNYVFCSSSCEAKFKADPAKNAKALREEMIKQIGADKAFTCSMHPDVIHAGPGKCPICGMKLEAVKAGK